MKTKIIKTIFAGLTFASVVHADPVNVPSVKEGDTWTYKNTIERGANGWTQTHNVISVTRATTSSIYYSQKQNDSNRPPLEAVALTDWSRIRNIGGKETVVNKPFEFPLTPGKSWQVEYTEETPNKGHKSEHWVDKYTVVKTERIEVPAGKFEAVKVECEGNWVAQIDAKKSVVQAGQAGPAGAATAARVQMTPATTVTGRTYKAFWYVPETKRFVKSVEEYYDANGVRNERYTGELESYKVSE